MTIFTCYLCTRRGDVSGIRYGYGGKSAICVDCVAMLAAQDRRWCNYAKHVVAQADYVAANHRCKTCRYLSKLKQRGITPAPVGYVPVTTVAKQIFIGGAAIHRWIACNWDVPTIRGGKRIWVKQLATYPPPPKQGRTHR